MIGIIKSYDKITDNMLDACSPLGGLTAKEIYAIDLQSRQLRNKIGISNIQSWYPFVGGDANRHKFNALNPDDTDGAYRLTFFGSLTHNSNGITGDGTTGYADTHLTPQTLGLYGGIYLYNRVEQQSNAREVGALSSTPDSQFSTAGMRRTTNVYIVRPFLATGNNNASAATTNSLGGFYFGRNLSSNVVVRRRSNSEEVFTSGITNSGTNITFSIYLFSGNFAGVTNTFSPRNISTFLFLNNYVSNTDELNTIINNGQTILGRNV
jgi:hypothetical protein